MATKELIETKSITSGGISSFVFTSIPQTYNTLVLRVNSRTSASSYYTNIWLRPNGAATDLASGVSATLYGNVGASAAPQYTRISNGAWMADLNAASCYANTFGNAEITIPGYAKTTSANKAVLIDSINPTDGLVNQYPEISGSILYCSAPITQLGIFLGASTFDVGSYASLYGVKGA